MFSTTVERSRPNTQNLNSAPFPDSSLANFLTPNHVNFIKKNGVTNYLDSFCDPKSPGDRSLVEKMLFPERYVSDYYEKSPDEQRKCASMKVGYLDPKTHLNEVNRFVRWALKREFPKLVGEVLERWNVTHLDLSGKQIGDDQGAKILADVLMHNASIRSVRLDSCNLGDGAVEKLAECLIFRLSPVFISTSGNNFSKEGSAILEAAAQRNAYSPSSAYKLASQCRDHAVDPQIKHFFETGTFPTSEQTLLTMMIVIHVLKNSKDSISDLNACLEDAAIKFLACTVKDEGELLLIAKWLATSPPIEAFNFNLQPISKSTSIQLCNAIAANKSLRRLQLAIWDETQERGNALPKSQVVINEIEIAMQQNRTLTEIDLYTSYQTSNQITEATESALERNKAIARSMIAV
ncbi:hypothetical protein [Variovorax sp. KK3]|uniref:hypothetical protein n=1 Tax=Variovorax sp. KK3 TaxID=1855728 RepID=UPI00117F35CF|nr:hypothetical protein [Variovorax sp. KK3]